MRHIVIDLKDTSLETERACLIVRHESWSKPQTIPLAQLESIIIQTTTTLKSNVITQLVTHGVRLQIIAGRGQGDSGYLVGAWHNDAKRRLQQYALVTNICSQWQWAKLIVCLRLRSQRLMLQQAAGIRDDLSPLLNHMAQHIKGVEHRCWQQHYNSGCTIDELRGREGAGTAMYFQAYQQLFPSSLQFTERNRRPPRDPVNVLLSLGATLLHGLFLKAVHTTGLDPQLGMLHEVSFGRNSLVCDLMEIKRAALEYWVWRLFATEIIRPEDFSFSNGSHQMPCLLGKAGRSRFYAEFAKVQVEWLKQAEQICWILVKRLAKHSS